MDFLKKRRITFINFIFASLLFFCHKKEFSILFVTSGNNSSSIFLVCMRLNVMANMQMFVIHHRHPRSIHVFKGYPGVYRFRSTSMLLSPTFQLIKRQNPQKHNRHPKNVCSPWTSMSWTLSMMGWNTSRIKCSRLLFPRKMWSKECISPNMVKGSELILQNVQ